MDFKEAMEQVFVHASMVSRPGGPGIIGCSDGCAVLYGDDGMELWTPRRDDVLSQDWMVVPKD